MGWSKIRRSMVVAILVWLSASTSLQAEVFRDVAFGLGQLGVTYRGQRNPLSGGNDFQAITNFQGNPLGFGLGDLTLQGPISFEVSNGTRGVPTIDFSLTTALNSNNQAIPLNYALTVDVGSQAETITGSLLIDADLSVNQLGFYDFNMFYSSRQTVQDQGRFSNDSQDFDFDLGPVDVQGNLFADALAVVTQPIFDATGGTNPFESFSSQGQLKRMLEAGDITSEQLALGDAVLREVITNSIVSMFIFPAQLQDGSTGSLVSGQPVGAATVPEPPVVMLMFAALPVVAFVMRRRSVASA